MTEDCSSDIILEDEDGNFYHLLFSIQNIDDFNAKNIGFLGVDLRDQNLAARFFTLGEKVWSESELKKPVRAGKGEIPEGLGYTEVRMVANKLLFYKPVERMEKVMVSSVENFLKTEKKYSVFVEHFGEANLSYKFLNLTYWEANDDNGNAGYIEISVNEPASDSTEEMSVCYAHFYPADGSLRSDLSF